MNSKKTLALIILISLGFIWGTGYSIARFAVTNGVPPFAYSFWQSLGPAIFLTALVFSKYRALPHDSNYMRYYLICGLTGIAIPNTSMYFAAAHLPASILAIIVNIVPIMAYPMALIAKLEKFNWIRFFGICLAFVGLMCIILPKSSLPSPAMIPWALATLITPFSFAFCSVYIARNQPAKSNAMILSAGMMIASSLLLIPMLFVSHSWYFFHYPLTLPDWVVLLEIVLSSIGYILFFQLIKIAGPVFYSLVDTIVVLTGIFWGYIIFSEQLNQWTMLAVGCILIALMLVTQQQSQKSS